jgi:hypothetical protein
MPEPCKTWDPGSFAYWGALAGMTLVLVLEVSGVFGGRFDDVDPFIHVLAEMAGFACCGAKVSAAVAGMRNRIRRRHPRRSRAAPEP